MIIEIPLLQDSLIFEALPRTDYADAFRREIDPLGRTTAEEAARELFRSVPPWVGTLMTLRDCLVKRLGLKTTPPVSRGYEFHTLQPGETVGLFRVYANTPDEIVLGQNDVHLDFRVSLRVNEIAGQSFLTLTTIVQFHNVFGRLYFAPVKIFHKRIVRAMLGSWRG